MHDYVVCFTTFAKVRFYLSDSRHWKFNKNKPAKAQIIQARCGTLLQANYRQWRTTIDDHRFVLNFNLFANSCHKVAVAANALFDDINVVPYCKNGLMH